MDNSSARRLRLWEAMESCRSGSDDLSSPLFAELAARLAADSELREQFQRLQEADGAIRAAFADVAIPAGLADRVSHRLAEERRAAVSVSAVQREAKGPKNGRRRKFRIRVQAASDRVAAATADKVERPSTTSDASTRSRIQRKQPERFSRRRLLLGFAGISAAAALLAAVWIETHQPRHDTPTSVLEEAMEYFNKDNQPPGEFVGRVAPPAPFSISRDIVPFQGIRWRHVETFLGSPAVAFDLPTIRGRATLYVVERNVAGLPSIPPSMPSLSTGGKSAAAWQVGDTLYVLVVEGGAGIYGRYLDQSHGPLT